VKKYVWATTAVALIAVAGPAASAAAHPTDRVENANRSTVVLTASDPAPRVTVKKAPAPLPRVTVVSGDTLSGIGARTHRTWQQLASFNHIANPNLIYVGDVEVIPPATYVAGPMSLPTVAPSYTPPVRSYSAPVVHYSAPVVRYTPRPAPVVSRSYGASGSFQSCVAFRESTNGAGSSNIYGILNSTWASLGRSGSAYTASRSEQDAAFAQLYARDGAQPWAPYDGC
jgi:LysM repeat protein